MKYRFISIIHYLKLSKPECRIPLVSGMISNKASALKDVLNYKSALSLHTLGRHSIDEFENTTFYVLDGEFEEGITLKDVDTFGTSLTFAFLRQIQSLTNEEKKWPVYDIVFPLYVKSNGEGLDIVFKHEMAQMKYESKDIPSARDFIESLKKELINPLPIIYPLD